MAIASIFEKPNFLTTNDSKKQKPPIKTAPTEHNHIQILRRPMRVQS